MSEAQTPPPVEYHESGDRVARARERVGDDVRKALAAKGVSSPASFVFLRAFKHERELELWAGDSPGGLALIKTYPVAAASGGPGPKRREGDRQVPEGIYFVDRFNPQSSFHLSLGLNYPNESDRIRSDRDRPGSDIFIHGRAVSIGCLAMTDPVIEFIYILADGARSAGQRQIPVHIFPARPGTAAWDDLMERHPEHRAFWREIEPAYEFFETTKTLPIMAVGPDGRYLIGSRR
jgi:murein L,D-transpeptidase YafK